MISKRSLLPVLVIGSIAPLARVSTYRATAQTQPTQPMEARSMQVYMAGPLGFSEVGKHFYQGILIPKVKDLGYAVLDPWTLTDVAKIAAVEQMPYGEAKRVAFRKLDEEIGGNNQSAIDRCDLVLAVLDGVDVDSGTAAEIGYAYAKGKPILGYRGDTRISSDNEGAIVNLQVEYFIRQSGGDIVTKVDDLGPALARTKQAVLRRQK